jgi:uncharacterized membrane protein YcaP (DUF421 family)
MATGGNMEHILGLGVQAKDMNTLQVCARAIVVLFAALVIMKMAHHRFMAKKTAFEFVLAFMLVSVLGRAINGSAPLFPSIAAGFLLVFVQWLTAGLACRFKSWEWLVKGKTKTLIKNGILNQTALSSSDLSRDDLLEDLRLEAQTEDISKIYLARLERSGDISVLSKPEVVLLKIENGVQFVELRIAN